MCAITQLNHQSESKNKGRQGRLRAGLKRFETLDRSVTVSTTAAVQSK